MATSQGRMSGGTLADIGKEWPEVKGQIQEASSAASMMKWLGILGIGLLVLMYCQNQDLKEKQKDQNKKLDQLLVQKPANVIVAQPASSSSSSGGSVPGGASCENNWGGKFTYATGDCMKKCSANPPYNECSTNQLCKDGAWARSSDAPYCCSSICVTRIQTTLLLSDKVFIVERVGSEFIVWPNGVSQLGFSPFVKASPVGNNVYSFQTGDATYTFTVTRNEESSLEVRP